MEDQSRRRMMKSAGLIGGLGVIPAVSSADEPSKQSEPGSLEREELVSTDEYEAYKYRVDGQVLYLKLLGEREGMQILRPSDVSEAERQDVSKLVRSNEWTDKVTRYKVETGNLVTESCSAFDGYGNHWYGTATAEFKVPIKFVQYDVVKTVINELLRDLGLPELGDVLGTIAGAVAGYASPDCTVGAKENDGYFGTPTVRAKYGVGWDEPINSLTGGPALPGVHKRDTVLPV